MIARRVRGRSGITLTEILISILIMGIGLISLATLFPLGLIRLRDASRFQRGAMLAQSLTDDMDARSLLLKPTFTQTWYWTASGNNTKVPRDPFTADFAIPQSSAVTTLGVGISAQPGLPIVYDPLWRAVTGVMPNIALADPKLNFTLSSPPFQMAEARFGAGVTANGSLIPAFNLRTTAPGDNGHPSAYGLQRITNFIPWSSVNYTALYPFTHHNSLFGAQANDVAADTFISIDDIVFNSSETAGSTRLSPLLPDLTLSSTGTVNDWKYTWFFTGRQVDSTNGTMFQGDVVVTDSRQFVATPAMVGNGSTNEFTAVGETVVEAVFGYSTQVNPIQNGVGYSVGADRTVLIRWPTTVTDPSVRIGGWIADVTYERYLTASQTKVSLPTASTGKPFQRCNWYQIVKRTDAQPDPDFAGYRRMILTISSPVKTKTLIARGGIPQFLNVAMIMPSVIYVYPRAFTVPQTLPIY